jgi:hypothetical protein
MVISGQVWLMNLVRRTNLLKFRNFILVWGIIRTEVWAFQKVRRGCQSSDRVQNDILFKWKM